MPLSEVPRYVPTRRGKRVHYSTVYRWATKGARGRILETVLCGGLRYTSIQAVQRFLSLRAIKDSPSFAEQDLGDVIDAALRNAGV
ncbi:MAG: DUF1580 domain-containing protein [Pirellulaceae bacterium]